jgi:uncharacterized protein
MGQHVQDRLHSPSVNARIGRRFCDAGCLARIVTDAGVVVCERCELAESTFARMRGLLGRDGLAPGEGMLINPSPSVMTFFMRFPIDVVFLDREWTIVRIVDSLGAWRVASARKAVAALELPSGAAETIGLQSGMRLEIED